jgi:hypothetical protein
VTPDLFSPFKVASWASARADCPMRYAITNSDEMVIIFGSGSDEFEFSFHSSALRALVQLGADVLTKMEARADKLVPAN